MLTEAFMGSQLFDNRADCCLKHNCDGDDTRNPNALDGDTDATPAPNVPDAVTFADEDFERGISELPWKQGGTASHGAGWSVEPDNTRPGKYSLVSGDLMGQRGKKSDISLKVRASSAGANIEFHYKAGVTKPYDTFDIIVDGQIQKRVVNLSETGWSVFSTTVGPGTHTLLLRVETETSPVEEFGRDDIYGNGRVYIDDFKFMPIVTTPAPTVMVQQVVMNPDPTHSPTNKPTPSPTPVPTAKPVDTYVGPQRYWYPDIHQGDEGVCVYGSNFPSWMLRASFRAKSLFDNRTDCCIEHNCDGDDTRNPNALDSDTDATPAPIRTDVITFAEEDFEKGLENLPWRQGGSATHVADWSVGSDTVKSGTKSLVSGDLTGQRGVTSDLSLKVDSSIGATVEFYYKAGVSFPFDLFDILVDGQVKKRLANPSGPGWTRFSMSLFPGEHTLLLRVETPTVPLGYARDGMEDTWGDGKVIIEDFKFLPLTR